MEIKKKNRLLINNGICSVNQCNIHQKKSFLLYIELQKTKDDKLNSIDNESQHTQKHDLKKNIKKTLKRNSK